MEIYVVLFWFWDGDGYLINSYDKCFLNLERAVQFARETSQENGKVFLPGEDLPKEEDGHHLTPGFKQVIIEVLS